MIGLFTAIGNVLTTGLNRWGQVRTAKHKAHLAKIQVSGQVQKIKAQHVANWETIQAQNSSTSWKDQFLTLVLTAPFIAGFVPALQPYIEHGFEFMASAPAWYQTCFLIVVSASFGLRIFPHIGRMLGKGS